MKTFKNQRSFPMMNLQIVISIIIIFYLFTYKFTYIHIVFAGLIFLNSYFIILKYKFPNIIYIENNTLSIVKGKKKYDFNLTNLEYLKWHKSFLDKINDSVSMIIKSNDNNEIILKLNSFSDKDMKQIINEINITLPGKKLN